MLLNFLVNVAQAYTNELENEVERLKEENAMLRRQQEQVHIMTAIVFVYILPYLRPMTHLYIIIYLCVLIIIWKWTVAGGNNSSDD